MSNKGNRVVCLRLVVACLAALPSFTFAAEPEPSAAAMTVQTVALRIEKMACSSCAARVEKVLKEIPGVKTARVSMNPSGAVIEYDPTRVTPARLVAAVVDAGFEASVAPKG